MGGVLGKGNRKVLLVGWDGADWKVASPLIDSGQMPNLQRLIETGVMGNISTLYPVLSPMLWTSIATGKRANKHGIHGFAEPDPANGKVRPITNLSRKCKAVWNILNQQGYKCNVVGWWPSHPAEPINGVMVSNHFQSASHSGDGKWPIRQGTIHPAKKTEQLAKFRIHPNEIEGEQILPFIPGARDVDQEQDKRVFGVAKILAEISGVHAAATAIMQHEPWDFMGIYYDGIDHFSHGYMKYHPPKLDWVEEVDFATYRHVIEAAYKFHDMMLGVLMQLAGPDTTVILLSDHGFHPDSLRPKVVSNEPAGPADEHRQFGMLVINGPGIKQDDLVFGASLLDITPTVLSLFDEAVARDMDGRPLIEIFCDQPDIQRIDSWEDVAGSDGRHPPDTNFDVFDAQESLKQLVDLGYIENPDEQGENTTRNTVRELRYNLARDLLDANQLVDAIRELQQLWDDFPDETRFGVKIFFAMLKAENSSGAELALERILNTKKQIVQTARQEIKEMLEDSGDNGFDDLSQEQQNKYVKLTRKATTNPHTFSYLKGSLLFAKGQYSEALETLENARSVQARNLPAVEQKIGECLMKLSRWSEAGQLYESIVEADAANPQAHLGLAQCYLAENRLRKAIESARSSIGLVYHNPIAHFILGKAQLSAGANLRAIESFKTGLSQNPVFPDCQKLLSKIYRQQGDLEKAEQHEALANQAAKRLDQFKNQLTIPKDTDLHLDIVMDQPIGIGEIRNDNDRSGEDAIIVVSGLPRSGTSMMMQMLMAGGVPILMDDQRPADASNQKGYQEFEPVKRLRNDNSWLPDAKGKAIKVVAPLIPALASGLRYRIIYMARPLGDIIRSQNKMLERLNRSGGSSSERQLATTYKKQVHRVRETILQYPLANVITVNYYDVLTDAKSTAKVIEDFLGQQLNIEKMIAAVDSSLRNE